MRYIYCPNCGNKLGTRQAGDDGAVPFCEPCDKYWFDNFHNCVIILTYNELDELVLCKQNYLSEKYYNFTAGYIKPGETAESTAVREVKEELGLDVENLQYVGSYWFEKNELLMSAYLAYAKKAEFKTSMEVDEARWVRIEEAPSLMFPDSPGNAMWPLYNKLKEIKDL